ncbi:unnamed protein product [Ceutorhynchus assimilis]|uniref:GH18 domain-containing protein n=1 Tax=Ceutorhynchus assimilis TaxID=467358 RepID=A0A9N9MGS3_9CUCU|nr:unnamed protein product [Ceutorhynchus assimilis]
MVHLLVTSLCLAALVYSVNSVAVIGYYASWLAYQGITPEILDASLLTHLNYAFISMWDNGNLKVADDNLEISQGLFYRITDLKKRNPNLKVLLSVGGASAGTEIFANIAADPQKRGAFIGSASYFISTYHFDGLDIDWEYPTAADRANYITLLRETKAAFQPKGWLVTAAVAANPSDGYDVGQMNNYLDIINLMTYDYYGPWSSYTGQNSALFASSVESDWEKSNNNVAASAQNWLNAGAQRNKIAIGVGFYGRTFKLADPNQHGLHAPISGVGPDGGVPDYSLICSNYQSWTRVWDDQQKNPYKYQSNNWVGYDDKDSVWAKGSWTKSQNFFGVMVWHISGDDVRGTCSGETQQLLRQLNRSIQ